MHLINLPCRKIKEKLHYAEIYLQNRLPPRRGILMSIAEVLDIDVKKLIISNKNNG